MCTLLPLLRDPLVKAAGVGVLLGVGIELVDTKGKSPRGKDTLTSIIACVALRALALYTSLGVATAVGIGVTSAALLSLPEYLQEKRSNLTTEKTREIAGWMLIGGTLGYVVTDICRRIPLALLC